MYDINSKIELKLGEVEKQVSYTSTNPYSTRCKIKYACFVDFEWKRKTDSEQNSVYTTLTIMLIYCYLLACNTFLVYHDKNKIFFKRYIKLRV